MYKEESARRCEAQGQAAAPGETGLLAVPQHDGKYHMAKKQMLNSQPQALFYYINSLTRTEL